MTSVAQCAMWPILNVMVITDLIDRLIYYKSWITRFLIPVIQNDAK